MAAGSGAAGGDRAVLVAAAWWQRWQRDGCIDSAVTAYAEAAREQCGGGVGGGSGGGSGGGQQGDRAVAAARQGRRQW